MATDSENSIVSPSQTSGADAPDPEGIIPAEQEAPVAPPETPAPDPELGSPVVGQTTGSDEPTTGGVANRPPEEGIDAMDPMQAVKDYAESKAV